MPQKWSQKGLDWVGRTVLSADYDDVSVLDQRNQEYMKKSIKVVLKLKKSGIFLKN